MLRGVSLDLRPGERLAIVGPSGAGKSTLGRLMAGIDGPREGRVEVGGVRLVDLELAQLRGQVALVTQEHHVFVGTLEDNLRLARPEASREQLLDALAAVDARGWALELPEGLDTLVGSGGHRLTEPQAQQLALARLVLADPHTLVLDEATSLLDPRAARHLERSLAAVVEGRTVVAIAHRLRRRTTPTGSASSRTAGSARSARTTSCSRPTAPMPRSGARGATSPSRPAEPASGTSPGFGKESTGPVTRLLLPRCQRGAGRFLDRLLARTAGWGRL